MGNDTCTNSSTASSMLSEENQRSSYSTRKSLRRLMMHNRAICRIAIAVLTLGLGSLLFWQNQATVRRRLKTKMCLCCFNEVEVVKGVKWETCTNGHMKVMCQKEKVCPDCVVRQSHDKSDDICVKCFFFRANQPDIFKHENVGVLLKQWVTMRWEDTHAVLKGYGYHQATESNADYYEGNWIKPAPVQEVAGRSRSNGFDATMRDPNVDWQMRD